MYHQFANPSTFHLIGRLLHVLIIFAGAFFLLWYYLKHTRKTIPETPKNEDQKIILPLRLQAYERFVLFLERIHPSNLLMRINSPELPAYQLQSLLIRTIREEFEYNLSQQLYVSQRSWEMVRNAKEETVSMINQAFAKVGEDATSSDLVKEILELSISRGKLPVDMAIEEIKTELQRLF
jgi:hypothetical protein